MYFHYKLLINLQTEMRLTAKWNWLKNETDLSGPFCVESGRNDERIVSHTLYTWMVSRLEQISQQIKMMCRCLWLAKHILRWHFAITLNSTLLVLLPLSCPSVFIRLLITIVLKRDFSILLLRFSSGTNPAKKDAKQNTNLNHLTISVLQACYAVTPEYGIPSDFVRKLTVSL